MLKRLRIKFILINMMMAVLVLATTFGVVCYLDYANSLNSVYGQLNNVLARVASSMVEQIEDVRSINVQAPSPIDSVDSIDSIDNSKLDDSADASSADASSDLSSPTNSTDTDNSTSSSTSNGDSKSATESANSDSENASQKTTAATAVSAFVYDETSLIPSAPNESIVPAPNIGTTADAAQSATPTILVAVYKLSDQGFYTTIPDFSIASISESVLLQVNSIAMNATENHGYISEFDLCFERMPIDDGLIVAYADASSIHAWKNLAFMLLAVGIAALLVFFLINLFFSRWALRPVAQSIKQQQQFTADASHELKTPLTVILANMSILESQPDSTVEEQMQWVESTQTEATRMQLLVNEMLNLARPVEDKAMKKPAHARKNLNGKDGGVDRGSVEKSKVDFSDLVEGEVLQFESVAFERGIEMNSDIKQDVHVLGDAERLGRMVSTLIDNACKYTSENGKVNVVLTSQSSSSAKATKNGNGGKNGKTAKNAKTTKNAASKNDTAAKSEKNGKVKNGKNGKNGCVVLKVHNNGTPISEEDLPHLFDRFYRADKARTSGKGGYGLGLAIGREIAREHKGDITVESTEKDGTTFTVSLPLLSIHE